MLWSQIDLIDTNLMDNSPLDDLKKYMLSMNLGTFIFENMELMMVEVGITSFDNLRVAETEKINRNMIKSLYAQDN